MTVAEVSEFTQRVILMHLREHLLQHDCAPVEDSWAQNIERRYQEQLNEERVAFTFVRDEQDPTE